MKQTLINVNRKIIVMKSKVIFLALFTGMILINNVQLSAQKIFENNPFSVIQVLKNQNDKSITLAWNDNRFEEIEIYNEYGLLMPSIPILNARQISLNDLVEGNYIVIFKNQNAVIATKEFTVIGSEDIVKN
jgi:hypothetical protein